LRELFPGLQVVATTHSPLIVANSEVGELVRIERDGAELTVQAIDTSFEGFRADQILTTSAFGLKTTRSLRSEEKRQRYAELLGRRARTPEEEAEFARIEDELESGPRAAETVSERDASRIVDEALRAQIESIVATKGDAREALMSEIEKYSAKVRSGE
jgi:hypothetical protein